MLTDPKIYIAKAAWETAVASNIVRTGSPYAYQTDPECLALQATWHQAIEDAHVALQDEIAAERADYYLWMLGVR